MSQILDGFEDIKEKRDWANILYYLKIFSLVLVVIGFGIYVGDVLFGKSSLDVLLNLESQKQALEQNIDTLKTQNAILQKEYFELRGLEPYGKGF